MDLLAKELGPEGKLKLELLEGKVVLTVALDSKGLDGELKLVLEAEYFGEKLKGLIGGKVDDLVIDLLLNALKAM
jgi:hypothetical protein